MWKFYRIFEIEIIFPPDVAYPTSYLNDVRVDLRPEVAPLVLPLVFLILTNIT